VTSLHELSERTVLKTEDCIGFGSGSSVRFHFLQLGLAVILAVVGISQESREHAAAAGHTMRNPS